MGPALMWGPGHIDSAEFNYVWTHQVAEALGRGELYPRWLTGSFWGLGSPTFYFYPPLAFHVAGLLDLAGLTTLQAIKAAALLMLAGSGAAMHLWLRGKTRWPILGACLYMAAPYHLADFYDRAALAEFAAFCWLPLIALAIEAQPRRWAAPALALAYLGMILTHLPMAVLTGALLIPALAVRVALVRKDWGVAVRCGLAGLVAVALSMAYLLPALTLQGHITSEVFWRPSYQPANWSVLAPAVTANKKLILYAFAFLAAGAAVAAISAWRRANVFWPWLAVALTALSLGLVPGFWSLPVLDRVQFPWRVLALVDFAMVTAICLAPPRRMALIAAGALALPGVVFMVGVAGAGLRAPWPADIAVALPDAIEYLPPGLKRAELARTFGQAGPNLLRGSPVRGPARQLAVKDDGSMTLEASAPGVVVVRRASFPIWRVTRDGVAVATLPGPLLRFPVRPGVYRVEKTALPQERVGALISGLALPALAGLALLGRGRRRPGEGARGHARDSAGADFGPRPISPA